MKERNKAMKDKRYMEKEGSMEEEEFKLESDRGIKEGR